MLQSVQPIFTQADRLAASQHLQSRQIRLKRTFIMQIDVEAKKIEKRQFEVFGGWVVGISDQSTWVSLTHGLTQLRDELFAATLSVPTHDLSWDFIADT